jgi:hypothetical protein
VNEEALTKMISTNCFKYTREKKNTLVQSVTPRGEIENDEDPLVPNSHGHFHTF